MNEEINEKLDEVMLSQIEDLYDLDPGSKERSAVVEDIAKLYKVRMEAEKNENDLYDARLKRTNEFEEIEREDELKKKQFKVDIRNSIIKYSIEAAAIAVPAAVNVYFMVKGFKFEETGGYCSTTFRNLFSKIKPTK
jgi:ABC-type uncharacterized transport system involved in gliding motility auxiliary subunit